jgi:transcriptional regulator with XRE-family HTH domain
MKKTKTQNNQPLPIGFLLGRNIARERHAKGWTQQELAEQVGIDSVTLSRIEIGVSVPSIARLAEFADVLGINLAGLVSGVSQKVTDQTEEITLCMKQLTVSDRLLLLQILKQFAGGLAQK